MKFWIPILVAAIFSFGLSFISPWWIVVPVCLMVSFLFKVKIKHAFLMGFCAIFFLWFAQSFFIDMQNDSILSSKIGELFQGLSSLLLTGITGLLGGILGGLGSQIGAELNRYRESK